MSLSKCSLQSITVTQEISYIEISNLRIYFLTKRRKIPRSLSLILELPVYLKLKRRWARSLVPLTILHLRSLRRTTTKNVISGHVVLFYISYCAVTLLSMELQTNKSFKLYLLVSLLLMKKSGKTSLLKLKILFVNFSNSTPTRELLLQMQSNILGLSTLLLRTLLARPLPKRLLITWKTLERVRSFKWPLLLLLLVIWPQETRRRILKKFSKRWILTEMVSYQRMKSFKDTRSTLVYLWLKKQLTKCSNRLISMEMEVSITPNSSWLPWTKKNWHQTSVWLPLSSSLTRMAVVLSLLMKSKPS